MGNIQLNQEMEELIDKLANENWEEAGSTLSVQEKNQKIHDFVDKVQQKFFAGYEALINELEAIQTIQEQNGLGKGSLAPYLPDWEKVKLALNQESMAEKLNAGQSLSEIFGFHEDTLVRFYEIACDFMHRNRLEDASNAFYALTVLEPKVASFWYELACCHLACQKPEEAFQAFTVAATINKESPLISVEAFRQFSNLQDHAKAQFFADKLKEFTTKHPAHENTPAILQLLQEQV